MDLQQRMHDIKEKQYAHRKGQRDVLGDVALWYGPEPAAYSGNMTFGSYKQPDKQIKFYIALYWPDDLIDNRKEKLSGHVLEPKSKEERKKGRSRQVGKVRMYEAEKDESYYLVIWLGGFLEDGNFDYSGATTYTVPLKENVSSNSKAPYFKGPIFPQKNKDTIAKQKQEFYESRPVVKNKANSFYNPEDIIEVLKSYDKQQLNQVFWALADLEGVPDVVFDVLRSEEFQQRKQNQFAPKDEDYFQYVDEEQDDDDYEDFEGEDQESAIYGQFEEENQGTSEEDDIPQISLKFKREGRPRIKDAVASMSKRVGSSVVQDLDVTHTAEEIL